VLVSVQLRAGKPGAAPSDPRALPDRVPGSLSSRATGNGAIR